MPNIGGEKLFPVGDGGDQFDRETAYGVRTYDDCWAGLLDFGAYGGIEIDQPDFSPSWSGGSRSLSEKVLRGGYKKVSA